MQIQRFKNVLNCGDRVSFKAGRLYEEKIKAFARNVLHNRTRQSWVENLEGEYGGSENSGW